MSALVSLDCVKANLHVDSSDDDNILDIYLAAATRLSADVARLSSEQENIVCYGAEDTDELYTSEELSRIQELMTQSILCAVAYMFEHKENADYHELTLSLRALLSSVREEVW